MSDQETPQGSPASPQAEQQSSTPPASKDPSVPQRDWRAIGILVGVGLLIVFGLWQTVALSLARKQAAADLAAAEKSKIAAVDAARRAGAEQTAAALGAGLNQMFLLRTQYPEISDRTFRAICDELAATGYFDLSMILDSHRRVIASSDQQYVGQTYEKPVTGSPISEAADGKWQVTAPVKSRDATLGGVVLRLK